MISIRIKYLNDMLIADLKHNLETRILYITKLICASLCYSTVRVSCTRDSARITSYNYTY